MQLTHYSPTTYVTGRPPFRAAAAGPIPGQKSERRGKRASGPRPFRTDRSQNEEVILQPSEVVCTQITVIAARATRRGYITAGRCPPAIAAARIDDQRRWLHSYEQYRIGSNFYGTVTVSRPLRVDSPCQRLSSMLSENAWTEASISKTCTTPGWRLRAARNELPPPPLLTQGNCSAG